MSWASDKIGGEIVGLAMARQSIDTATQQTGRDPEEMCQCGHEKSFHMESGTCFEGEFPKYCKCDGFRPESSATQQREPQLSVDEMWKAIKAIFPYAARVKHHNGPIESGWFVALNGKERYPRDVRFIFSTEDWSISDAYSRLPKPAPVEQSKPSLEDVATALREALEDCRMNLTASHNDALMGSRPSVADTEEMKACLKRCTLAVESHELWKESQR